LKSALPISNSLLCAAPSAAQRSEAKMSESKAPKPKRLPATPIAVTQPAAQPAPKIAVQPVRPAAEKIAAATALPRPVRGSSQNAAEQLLSVYRATAASVGESQRAVASGVTALALEMTGLARATLTEAGESAAALIHARNFADAVEIQFGFARRSFASLIARSTRLSEIGARLATEASRPIVAPLGGSARAD
jgi:phasin family protein